ncbi:MAG TPA: DnaJ domain-containing protein [Thermomicrobiales bacterium]|nr:DnaJ domain-containing protein [Thermomicrobiales bacterium]
MVFPLIGARDYIEQRGFYIHECPSCKAPAIFAVYETRRKMTLYFVPTVPVRSQYVMECMTCHNKWGVPKEQLNSLLSSLMTQEELAERTREAQRRAQMLANGQMPLGAVGGPPTLYEVLQVHYNAEPEVVEAAFKRLALKYHPDRSKDPDAPARMRALITARDILGNEEKRAVYDRSLGIVRQKRVIRTEALRADEV